MKTRGWSTLALVLPLLLVSTMQAQSASNIHTATLGESGAKTQEISTEELRRILAEKSAMVFDVRPAMEFATSHIPGAVKVAQKPGTSKALYVSDVAEISRLLGGDKAKSVVLYCNGAFCGKSKRVSEDLLAAGFTNVRRYQLGIPVWRALGGVTQIEPDGVQYVTQNDHTAVWLDTRAAEDIAKAPLPGAKRFGVEVAKGGKDNAAMQQAKNDGTLPMEDHNTRIIVFGDDPQAVRSVAEAIAKEAFHNVAFFVGNAADLKRAVK
jgi:rhodanese-related sulfurtransferase